MDRADAVACPCSSLQLVDLQPVAGRLDRLWATL